MPTKNYLKSNDLSGKEFTIEAVRIDFWSVVIRGHLSTGESFTHDFSSQGKCGQLVRKNSKKVPMTGKYLKTGRNVSLELIKDGATIGVS